MVVLFLVSRKTKSEMAAIRFTSLSEENITQLLNNKDSEDTKKSFWVLYLKEKNIRNPTTAVELVAVLRVLL